jgi:hypothetical protein
MTVKPRSRQTALAAALVVAVALTTGAALAHVRDTEYLLFDNEASTWEKSQCVRGLARVAHGNYDHGFARSRTRSFRSAYSGNCNWERRKDPGYIRAGMEWYKWHSQQGFWGLCVSFGYHYNPVRTWEYSIYHDFRHVRCGQGYYATYSYNHVWWRRQWRGSGIAGKHHFFWR